MRDQHVFEEFVAPSVDAYAYGARTSGETHGVVLTKPHVVSLILDLAGYDPGRDLPALTLLEPACGRGAFLSQAVERLLSSALARGVPFEGLASAIAAYDIDQDHVDESRKATTATLLRFGASGDVAAALSQGWVTCGDFLLAEHLRKFDFVVGNPPYVRIEQLDPYLHAEYRRRYRSLYDRADLYVAFIERGLELLSPDGVLAFVCADRWIANKYGQPLRRLVAEQFQVRCYVDLHSASPFESEVIAYPSIFAIGRGKPEAVSVLSLATASAEECASVIPALRLGATPAPGVKVSMYDSWFKGDEPWIVSSPEHLAALRSLESRFATIESDGATKVRIGVATGSDKTYIVGEAADIERDRLVPLVMRDDIEKGQVRDARRFVVNTFEDDGGLVDLAAYPRLAAYLAERVAEIKGRHVAQANPRGWFRTIDRVYPALVRAPKLLIPDIAGSNEVVYEKGRFLPHHNLYYVTSDSWDLEVLGGLLSSRVALFFVWSYAVKMRGGYLRFQAQYLRRIRVPAPSGLPGTLAGAIKRAFRERNFGKLDQLALRAYGLSALPEFEFVDTRR